MRSEDELLEISQKVNEFSNSDIMKRLTEFVVSRKRFINKLREILDRSDVKCEIKDIYIGEVSIAQMMVEEETYLAVDCIVRENEKEDWRMDTVFIPTKYIEDDRDNTDFIKGVKFLTKQIEKENIVLN
jgi:hypothetical protein